MWEILGALLLVIGAFFVLVAAFGLIRLPDVLSRMQATSKATTLGLSAIMAAAALHAGSLDTSLRVFLIILFTFLTAPIGAHMLARAAYRTASTGWRTLAVDDLGTAGETADGVERLAEAVPGTDRPAARALVCCGPGEDRVIPEARLDRFFPPAGVDRLEPPDGDAPHEVTAWVQMTLDRLMTSNYGLLIVHDPARPPALSAGTRRLIQRASVALWIAAADGRASDGPILLALDLPADRRRIRIARETLQQVATLARASGRALHLVHAWAPTSRTQHGADRLEAERARARAQIDDLVRRAGLEGVPVPRHVEPGHPRDVIPAVAASVEAGLLALRTRRRRWRLNTRLAPSIAEDVVSRVACAALILGPESDITWSNTASGDVRPHAADPARTVE